MLCFDDADGVAYADFILDLIGPLKVSVAPAPDGQTLRLTRVLPDGSTARAVLRIQRHAGTVDASKVRTILRSLGVPRRMIEELYGWTLPDYTDG